MPFLSPWSSLGSPDRERDLRGLRDLDLERSLGAGDLDRERLFERASRLSLPLERLLLRDRERDLDRDRDRDRERDPPERDRRRCDSTTNLIRRPFNSAPSNFSNAVFMS